MPGQGKQAKILSDKQISAALAAVERHRYPERDRVMILLSVRAGLRAKEISQATWGMVTDAEGRLGDALHLPNKASKGQNGGRTIPLHKELRAALALQLRFSFEMGATRFGLVSASPDRPRDDIGGLDAPLRELDGDTTDFLDRPADQERRFF